MISNFQRYWTNDEFLAYTLLFAAHADFLFDKEEKDLILTKVNIHAYTNVVNELLNDNDYQSLQKILKHIQQNKYSEKDIDVLLHEIELLFMCDGEYGVLEKNMMMNLTKLLQHQGDTELNY